MSRTILLADDSVTIQKVVELTFMEEDYAVVAVSNGEDALRALDDLEPELVITDLHMPKANGYEVCRKAKELGLPVLLLVGNVEPFQPEEADAAGVDGVVKKPFDSQELLQRVTELMSGAPAPAAVPADELELEVSPWDQAAEEDDVEITQAEGLVTTETIGAMAGGEDETASQAALGSPVEADDPTGSMPPPSPISERFAAISGEPAAAEAVSGNGASLSAEDVDRVARRVVELLGDTLLREVAWEVVPDLAEVVIKERIRELERQLE